MHVWQFRQERHRLEVYCLDQDEWYTTGLKALALVSMPDVSHSLPYICASFILSIHHFLSPSATWPYFTKWASRKLNVFHSHAMFKTLNCCFTMYSLHDVILILFLISQILSLSNPVKSNTLFKHFISHYIHNNFKKIKHMLTNPRRTQS